MSKMRLVRVNRVGNERVGFNENVGLEFTAFEGKELQDGIPYHKQAEFFSIHERHVDNFVQFLARENPGCEVEVFELKKVGQCPPGEFVLKEVSKDGILPA